MTDHFSARKLSRRAVLLGATGLAAYATTGRSPSSGAAAGAATDAAVQRSLLVAGVVPTVELAATDGWVSIADPTTTPHTDPFWPDPYGADHGPFDLYVFGFRNVSGQSSDQIAAQKGKAQIAAPQMAFDQGQEVRLKLHNLGLQQRPDLVDGHTVHWHGFVNAVPLFDGVPELSISVPIGRDFTYYFRPHDPGTYMYHCHFEDVEHVQMGMTGMVFVRPAQNGQSIGGFTKFAYNDGDGSTGYDREFAFMLNEIFVEGHYRDAHIQTTDWTDYKASFSTMNGRTYPDTVLPGGTTGTSGDLVAPTGAPRLQYQPISSLITANAGERVLLRMSSLGYENHTMTADSIPMTVVAKDAVELRNGPVVNHFQTTGVEVGPGESRDVIFTAPAYSSTLPGGTDAVGAFNTYLFYDRDYRAAGNSGGPGLGGMATEIRVYASGLPAQTVLSVTPASPSA